MSEARTRMVQLVVTPDTGLFAAFVDRPSRAHQLAGDIGAVVAEVPIVADYRGHEAVAPPADPAQPTADG